MLERLAYGFIHPVRESGDEGFRELDVVTELVRSSQPKDIVHGTHVMCVACNRVGGDEVKVHLVQ